VHVCGHFVQYNFDFLISRIYWQGMFRFLCAGFWVLAPCSLADWHEHFRGTCRLCSKCWDSNILRNVSNKLPVNTAQYPRRVWSSSAM